MHQLTTTDPIRRIAIRMMDHFLEMMELYYGFDKSGSMTVDKLPLFDGFAYDPEFSKQVLASMDNPFLIPIVLSWAHDSLKGEEDKKWLDEVTERYIRKDGSYDFTPLLLHIDIDFSWNTYFNDPVGAVIYAIDATDDIAARVDRLCFLGMDHLENTLHLTYIESLLRSYDKQGCSTGLDNVIDYLDDHQDLLTVWNKENPELYRSYSEARQPRVVNPYKGGGFTCIS